MIVKCIAQRLTDEQVLAVGPKYLRSQDYHVEVGRKYIVYGLDFVLSHELHLANVHHLNDYGHLASTPMCLFEIVDDRMSSLWITKMIGLDLVAIWPPSFFQKYYHDDLSEGETHIVEDFKKVQHFIDSEFEHKSWF